MGGVGRRVSVVAAVVAVAVVGCGRSQPQEVSVGAPGSSVVSTTPGSSVGTGTSLLVVAPPTSAPGIETARPAIVAAAMAKGEEHSFGDCVTDTVYATFTGSELAFAVKVLSLVNPTSQQSQAAVDASGINRAAEANLPDRVFAVEDTCRHLGPTTTSTPPASDGTTPPSTS